MIAKSQVKAFLNQLAAQADLVAPVSEDGKVVFRPVRDADKVVLDYQNGVSSPKDFFFPQTEEMFRFRQGPGVLELEEVVPNEARVIFGARPCDLAGILRLDKVFETGPFQDSYYLTRRAATTVIGLACEKPAATCFCTSCGITPGTSEGADLMFYATDSGVGGGTGDSYAVEAITEKGARLLADNARFFTDGGDVASVKKAYEAKDVPLKVDLEGITARTDPMFESPIWAQLSARCLSCGICTYVCPTCHCFLVTDKGRYDEGRRLRCWDSCMFTDYTKMAGGHNPRPTKKERTRQRFMHKLNYYPHRYDGLLLCVGCGRCVEKCPTGLHIAAVVEEITAAGGTKEVAVNG